MKEPVEKQIKINGAMLTIFEWGEPAEETILLIHATGFHARCWDQVVMGLGDAHVIAVDLRGHGRSEKLGPYLWKTFGDDVTCLIEELDLTGIIGVGHSMGGHSITWAAAGCQDRFNRLVLVDPVIMAPEFYALPDFMKNAYADGHPIAKRRKNFADADAMYANFEGRGSFAGWKPEVLRDYCEFGILPDESGDGYVLACPPDVEASIYMGNAGCDVHDLVSTVKVPVKVLRARQRTGERENLMDFSLSPTWPELASQFEQGEDIYLPELTHFIPMQDPDLVARHILQ
ncbi:MAG: alpha/beta hydrolase [Gammaproteobacteria bacterium]|nr:alpha/beta hydrolase [Gammaproteobacteria bacterium]